MFEERPQKLYDGLTDKINNLFARKPFFSTLLLCVLVSLAVFVVSMDYKSGEAKVKVTDTENGNVRASDDDIKPPDVKTPKELKVDLAGAVKKPGVYILTLGSRLGDLVSLGGGFSSDVSALWVSKNLNLSQNVNDGEKVYIPFEWDLALLDGSGKVRALSLGVVAGSKQAGLVATELKKMEVVASAGTATPSTKSTKTASSGSVIDQEVLESSQSFTPAPSGLLDSSTSGSSSSLVNVNTATISELDALPGIGPVYAGRIMENRPYASMEEFKEKSGLSVKLATSLQDLISF